MNRLTIKSNNGYALKLNNPQNDVEAKTQLMKQFKLSVNRLAEFENFLEDNNINNLENLKELISSNNKIDLAIAELEEVNSILTDTIIAVTENEMDLNKLYYWEEISAKFYEKIDNQIKRLKGEKW